MNKSEALRYAADQIENHTIDLGRGLGLYLRNQARSGIASWLRSRAAHLQERNRCTRPGCNFDHFHARKDT